MVTFLESYERELEKYWTKRSSSNRRYLIRVMRTGAGDIGADDELCQSRKEITCDVRHGSIKRVASAVGEGFIAIERVHQHLDRF